MRTFLVGLTSRPLSPLWRAVAAAVFACIAIRLSAYLAPIRAADLHATSAAIDFSDRNGLPLGTLLSRDQEHTAFVSLAQVSPYFLHAIIAAEDGRYYHHGPVDAAAVARATWQMIETRRVVSGASTIPMQLARMLSAGHIGISGKLLEVWGAWRIAAGMDREQILEAYVNRLPMGGNIYGVEAASRTYFGIPAAKLDLAQASLLAALPNDPTGLNPYGHLSALRSRQRYVLARMVADGYITTAQENTAGDESVALQPRDEGIVAGAHFLFYTAGTLPPGTTRARTTLDRPLQEFVETQIRQTLAGLAGHDVSQAAVLVVDNRTGDVLAYAGSADYFDDLALGRNDGVQSLRQPGSTLKPFLYQDALESHVIRPNTILQDTQAYYAIPGGQLYSPSDYSETYLGPVRVRVALADSLNVPAVRVLSLTGVGTFLDRLRALGFVHLDKPAEFYGLGLTLGSGEVSLWELTHAYLTAARSGDEIPLRVLLAGAGDASPHGSAVAAGRQIGDPAAWQLITDMLADPHARAASFGVDSMLAPPFPAAVKTGTSSDYRDTWTVGYTTDYTVGVWAGNFDGRPMRRVSGVVGAAPLWNRIMLHLHESRDPAPFALPATLVREPICATTGNVPGPNCPAVVSEYLYPQDLTGYFRTAMPPARSIGTAATIASKPVAMHIPRVRIVFPREGDEFVLHATNAGVEIGDAQALELQAAAAPNSYVRWRVNGKPIAALTANGLRAIWKLRDGAWTVEASDGSAADQVHIYVRRTVAQPLPTGFSLPGRST